MKNGTVYAEFLYFALLHKNNQRTPVTKIHLIFVIFFLNTLMDYPVLSLKSADLHIQHGRHGLICISKNDVNALQSPMFIRFFYEHPLINGFPWFSSKIS